MPPQNIIRLRISIQRHAVPDIKLVWPCAISEDVAISELLVQINQVIPLESGEWGLEDYAVELYDDFGGSYECLHFLQVAKILKEDDQVLIRCLQGQDLKRRRLNGRHQISTDGRHLIDGIAFGRPWLRSPQNRPAFHIPPRKRARVHCDDDENDTGSDQEQQFLLEGPDARDAEDDLYTDSQNNENDDDESLDREGDDATSECQQQVADELSLLIADNAALGDLGWDLRDMIAALRTAFPLTPISTIEAELIRRHKHIKNTYDTLATSNSPVLSFEEIMKHFSMRSSNVSRAELPEKQELLRLQNSITTLLPVDTQQEIHGKKESIDHTFEDTSSSLVKRNRQIEESSSESDDTSSDSSVSSGNDDCYCPDNDDDTSSTSSSCDDGTDSHEVNDGDGDNPITCSLAKQVDLIKSNEETSAGETKKAPGMGLTKTQKRNARRRRNAALRQKISIFENLRPEIFAPGIQEQLEQRKTRLLSTINHGSLLSDEPQACNHAAIMHETRVGGKLKSHDADESAICSDLQDSFPSQDVTQRKSSDALGIASSKTKNYVEMNKSRLVQGMGVNEGAPSAPETGNEHWRQKIIYRAVECQQQGCNLTEPPFPFKQRWDPLQKIPTKRKRKCASQHFGDEDCYEDDDYALYTETSSMEKKSKSQRNDPFVSMLEKCFQTDNQVDESSGRRSDSRSEGGPTVIDNRFPLPPADLSCLPVLETEAAQEGMIITWKQMAMSKATRWQPKIIQKTGRVLSGSNDTNVHVQLAARDRENRVKRYNGRTGERIYENFELPGTDSEDDGEDDGERMIPWAELMEPRVLQGLATGPDKS